MAAAFDAAEADPSPQAAELISSYLESARLLGRRLAELHVALATPAGDPAFAPESIGPLYLRSVYQSLRPPAAGHVWRRLNRRLRLLPPEIQADARELLTRADELNGRYRTIMSRRWSGQRIRVHGDLHLGQVLITGSDAAFIHFGGDLAASPTERQQKRLALRDVAGLLRSWQRVVDTALIGTEVGTNIVRPEDRPALEPWGRFWWEAVGGAFLRLFRRRRRASVHPHWPRRTAGVVRGVHVRPTDERIGRDVVATPGSGARTRPRIAGSAIGRGSLAAV